MKVVKFVPSSEWEWRFCVGFVSFFVGFFGGCYDRLVFRESDLRSISLGNDRPNGRAGMKGALSLPDAAPNSS
jgi:hypothetical protein